jgi:peptidoglycan biosynthesis protein MviN/MurJ (putative lipid II flippase)
MATEQTRQIGQNMYMTAVIITVFNLLAVPLAGAVGAAAALAAALAVQLLIVLRRSKRQFDMHLQFGRVAALLALAACAYVLANHVLDQEAVIYDLIAKVVVFMVFLIFTGASLLRTQQARNDLQSFLGPLTAKLRFQRRSDT